MQWLLQEKYKGEKTMDFFADCRRLALGEPLGYLIGHAPFLDCTIYLDNFPLIPRTETEFWVEKALAEITTYQAQSAGLGLAEIEPLRIIDMCAGSGCIGVATLKATANTLVDFAELDKRLLPTIAKNVNENIGDQTRCRIEQSNLFSAYPEEKYHFILANPPYIDDTLNRVDQSVRGFEPHLALFGGHGGLEIILQLITEAKYHLVPDGQLWIEHEPEQSKAIAAIATAHGFTTTTHQDQFGVERYSVLVLQ